MAEMFDDFSGLELKKGLKKALVVSAYKTQKLYLAPSVQRGPY